MPAIVPFLFQSLPISETHSFHFTRIYLQSPSPHAENTPKHTLWKCTKLPSTQSSSWSTSWLLVRHTRSETDEYGSNYGRHYASLTAALSHIFTLFGPFLHFLWKPYATCHSLNVLSYYYSSLLLPLWLAFFKVMIMATHFNSSNSVSLKNFSTNHLKLWSG